MHRLRFIYVTVIYVTVIGVAVTSVAVSGCISDNSASDDPFDESSGDAASDQGSRPAGDSGTTSGGSDDAGRGNEPPADLGPPRVRDGGAPTEAGDPPPPPPPPRPDAGEPPPPPTPPPPPPPDDDRALCAASCDRLRACMDPACPELEAIGSLDAICDALCSADGEQQRSLLALECPGYVDTLIGFIPELAPYCSGEPPPEVCAPICEYLPSCDVPIDGNACFGLCRGMDDAQRDCLDQATAERRCIDLYQCFEDDEEPPPEQDPRALCAERCDRITRCVVAECAPGALEEGALGQCIDDCLDDPPTGAEVRAERERLCADVVADIRRIDRNLDRRCDQDAAEACAAICESRVGDCMPPDDCHAACRDWNETNLACLRLAEHRCAVVHICVESPDQANCEQSCGRWQTCLEEACPPRLLSPYIGTDCAVGCLFDPVSEEEADAIRQMSCREVRESVYEDNHGLAQLCEGDRNFRPSPEECAAFCDEGGLAECIAVGGRAFCLGACATMTRESFECATAAGDDCAAIDICLDED